MKKHLWIFAAAAAALAACSNDDTIAVNQGFEDANAISFRPIVNNLTRAADINATTLETTGFYVSARKHSDNSEYFTNAEYTTYASISGTKTWTSPDKYYWPADDSELDFYAYSPATTNTQISQTDYKTFEVTPSTTISEQVDLIFANTNQKKKSTDNSGVVLNFRHTGAKIVCQVKNTSTTLKFGVDGWKVGYLSPDGTFVFSDTNTDGNNTGSGTTLSTGWTPGTASVATEYVSTLSEVSTINAKAANADAATTVLSGEMILVPQTLTAASGYANSGTPAANDKLNGTFIAVKLYVLNAANNALIAGGGTSASPTTIWAIWPIGGYSWDPGKKYTYTIDLAGAGYYENNIDTDANLDPILDGAEIKFVTVTVDNWTPVAKAVPES